MLTKVSTAQCTVAFKKPGEGLDCTIDQSFVGKFKVFESQDEFSAFLKARKSDVDVLRDTLFAVDGNSDITPVISDRYATYAAVKKLIEINNPENFAKNSET